jgi:hypothetical protein
MTHSFGQSTLMLGLAVLGTILSWMIINLFVVEITFTRFVIIEFTISVFHHLYNKAKEQCKQQK